MKTDKQTIKERRRLKAAERSRANTKKKSNHIRTEKDTERLKRYQRKQILWRKFDFLDE